MDRFVRFLGCALAVFMAAACGGGGGSTGVGQTPSAYAGVYMAGVAAAIQAPGTSLLVAVTPDGIAHVSLSDRTGLLCTGTGNIASSGKLLCRATGTGGTVNLVGTFTAGPPPSLQVEITGAQTASAVLTKDTADWTLLFGERFGGNFYGGSVTNGAIGGSLSSDGHFTGLAQNGSATFPVTGTVDMGGAVSIHGVGPDGAYTWIGTWYLSQNPGGAAVSGAWTGPNGLSGTWRAGVLI